MNESTMNVKDNLTALMKRDSLSARELAKITKTNRSTLSSILSGTNENPRDKTLEPYAAMFEISLAQLRGYEPIVGIDKNLPNDLYPIIDDHLIESWVSTSDVSKTAFGSFVRSVHPKGEKCFVYIANDNALSPIIPEGSRAFIDPEFSYPVNSTTLKIVLVKSNEQYALRVESVDLGVKMYKPTMEGFRSLTIDDCEVIGTVVGIPESNWENGASQELAIKLLTSKETKL